MGRRWFNPKSESALVPKGGKGGNSVRKQHVAPRENNTSDHRAIQTTGGCCDCRGAHRRLRPTVTVRAEDRELETARYVRTYVGYCGGISGK